MALRSHRVAGPALRTAALSIDRLKHLKESSRLIRCPAPATAANPNQRTRLDEGLDDAGALLKRCKGNDVDQKNSKNLELNTWKTKQIELKSNLIFVGLLLLIHLHNQFETRTPLKRLRELQILSDALWHKTSVLEVARLTLARASPGQVGRSCTKSNDEVKRLSQTKKVNCSNRKM